MHEKDPRGIDACLWIRQFVGLAKRHLGSSDPGSCKVPKWHQQRRGHTRSRSVISHLVQPYLMRPLLPYHVLPYTPLSTSRKSPKTSCSFRCSHVPRIPICPPSSVITLPPVSFLCPTPTIPATSSASSHCELAESSILAPCALEALSEPPGRRVLDHYPHPSFMPLLNVCAWHAE